MRAKTINEIGFESRDPKKALGFGIFRYGDPFIEELESALQDEIGENYAQNYEANIEFDGQEEDDTIIDSVIIKIEYNADFTDREGRHPWIEIIGNIDLKKKTIIFNGELESKNGRLHKKAKRKSKFENYDAEEIVNIVSDDVSDIGNDLEL